MGIQKFYFILTTLTFLMNIAFLQTLFSKYKTVSYEHKSDTKGFETNVDAFELEDSVVLYLSPLAALYTPARLCVYRGSAYVALP